MSAGPTPLDVPPHLWRGAHTSHEAWLSSALEILDLMAQVAGVPMLERAAVLDVGCGTKLTKVLVEEQRPIGRYVGVDVYQPVIDFLQEQVHDSRFEYHTLDAYNELYNPQGPQLGELAALPVGDEQFDLITLFSVFTHLAPHDYQPMLRLLRPHVRPEGRLLYSIFIDTPAPPAALPEDPDLFRAGIVELAAQLTSSDLRVRNNAIRSLAAFARGEGPDQEHHESFLTSTLMDIDPKAADVWIAILADPGPEPDFYDRIPDKPLMEAVYSESYARSLIEGTGWEVEELRPPVRGWIQHHFICRPV